MEILRNIMYILGDTLKKFHVGKVIRVYLKTIFKLTIDDSLTLVK